MSASILYCPCCGERRIPVQFGQPCPCGWRPRPNVGVAVVLLEEGQILLGLRRDGGWCIPCGHVEWNETVQNAAIREFREETGLVVELKRVLAVQSNFHDPFHHTVGVWFEGSRISGDFAAADDLLDLAWFPIQNPPPLKFPTDKSLIDQLRP